MKLVLKVGYTVYGIAMWKYTTNAIVLRELSKASYVNNFEGKLAFFPADYLLDFKLHHKKCTSYF